MSTREPVKPELPNAVAKTHWGVDSPRTVGDPDSGSPDFVMKR